MSAVVVAVAAMERLGWESRLTDVLDPVDVLPQAGQGAIAVQCRADDDAHAPAARPRSTTSRATGPCAPSGPCWPRSAGAARCRSGRSPRRRTGGAAGAAGVGAGGERRRAHGGPPDARGATTPRRSAPRWRGRCSTAAGRRSTASTSGAGARDRGDGDRDRLPGRGGPGRPRAAHPPRRALLARADVVLHDRLVSPAVLDLAPAEAELIDVGKDPDCRTEAAGARTRSTACWSSTGGGPRVVVRLKGGDPFLFGRGGEEVEALAEAGIPWEVVPGRDLCLRRPRRGRHPGHPARPRLVGHRGDRRVGEPARRCTGGPDWEALARAGGTLVILMGMSTRAAIADALVQAGRAPDTPVAVIARGTTPAQRVVRTTLAGLAGVDLGPPAVIVVGPVAALDAARRQGRGAAGRAHGGGHAVGPAGPGPRRPPRAGRGERSGAAADPPGRSRRRRRRAPGGCGGGGRAPLGRVHVGQRGRPLHGRAARRPGARRRVGGRGRPGHRRRAAPGRRRARPRAGRAQRSGAGRGVPRPRSRGKRNASCSPAPTSRPTPSPRASARRVGGAPRRGLPHGARSRSRPRAARAGRGGRRARRSRRPRRWRRSWPCGPPRAPRCRRPRTSCASGRRRPRRPGPPACRACHEAWGASAEGIVAELVGHFGPGHDDAS